MKRNEFITALGISAGTVMFAPFLSSCSKTTGALGNTTIDFTLDLTLAANSVLKSDGGSLIKDRVIVARTNSGTYVALAAGCTHQGTTILFDTANNNFRCPNHGSSFSTSGSVLVGPASIPLQKFNTQLTGNSLRVYS